MDFTLTPEQEAFRESVRTWLKANMPKGWDLRVVAASDVPRPEAYELLRKWQRTMYEAGFSAWVGRTTRPLRSSRCPSGSQACASAFRCQSASNT